MRSNSCFNLYDSFRTFRGEKTDLPNGEKYFFNIKTNSKKEYNAALEIQKRARKYIEEAKTKTEDDTHTL